MENQEEIMSEEEKLFSLTLEKLTETNLKLHKELKYAKEFINLMNANRCPKCRHYYLPGYKCHHCGYQKDEQDEEIG